MSFFLILILAIFIISLLTNFLFYIIFIYFAGQKIAKIINEEMETTKRKFWFFQYQEFFLFYIRLKIKIFYNISKLFF